MSIVIDSMCGNQGITTIKGAGSDRGGSWSKMCLGAIAQGTITAGSYWYAYPHVQATCPVNLRDPMCMMSIMGIALPLIIGSVGLAYAAQSLMKKPKVDVPLQVSSPTIIPVGGSPSFVAITPNGKEALVTNASVDGDCFVSVINLVDNTVKTPIFLSHQGESRGIAITPNGEEAVVSDGDTIFVINLKTNQIIGTIEGAEGGHIAITPQGTQAVAARESSVSVIDLLTNVVTATIPLGGQSQVSHGVAITPDGSRALVTNSAVRLNQHNVYIIDLLTNKVTQTIPVGTYEDSPKGVAVTPDGLKAVVASWNGTVSVIDLLLNKVTAVISMGDACGWPERVAITSDGSKALVTGFFENLVYVLDLSTNVVVNTVSVGMGPQGIAITPNDSEALVVNHTDGTVSVLGFLMDLG